MAAVPHPPMPLAIDALLPESSASESDHLSESNLSNANRATIDYNKYRTRMCHYFLVEKPCPFGDRCAFAHGEEQINTLMPQAALERLLHNQQQHASNANNSMHGHHNHNHSNNYGGYEMNRPSFMRNSMNGSGYTSHNANPTSPNGTVTGNRPQYSNYANNNAVMLSSSGRYSHHMSNAPTYHMHQSIHGSSNVTRVNSMNADEPLGGMKSPSGVEASMVLSASSSYSQLPPPPAYSQTEVPRLSTIIKSLSLSMLDSCSAGVVSDPTTPKDCPNRFRYDPYSPRGFVLSVSA